MPRDERTKADYQPWNHEHFMADRHVRRMHPHIRKSYVMLLHEAFFCSTRPYLPDDDNELWLLADCESLDEWKEQSTSVREMFDSIEVDGVKLLSQKRVEDDWGRILGKRGVVSERSRKAALSKWESASDKNSKTRSRRLSEARKIGTHTKEEWKALLEICSNICVRCGSELDICKDHIKPIYQGGSDHISNLQPLCKTCNSSKGPENVDFRPADWEERLRNACETPAEVETSAKRSKEKLSISEDETSEEPDFPENGQGEDELKAKKAIPTLCQQILHQKADMYPDTVAQIEAYAIATSNGQVIRQFEEWAVENVYEEFRGRPVAAFLRSLDNPRVTEAKQAASDPAVVDLARELAYLSDGVVSFNDKEKSGLGRLLTDGNTKEELVSIFRTFFADIQNDEFALKFAAKNFVEKADQLVYAARRKRAEKAQEAAAVERTAQHLQETAEAERRAREVARLKDQELVEEELPD